MSKVVIVGGGAAGMFASIAAAECGHQVVVYEKNEKLGKKLYITGKGRCNITNACDMEGLFEAVRTNAKFLYSSFYGYTNQQVIDFFERINVPVKIERGDRVFPVSDRSSDVIRGLEREMDRLGVEVHLRTAVKKIVEKNRDFKLLLIGEGELKNDYLEYIKNNKLEQNIILEQPQNDIYKYYSAFDIFAFPSRFEGLGIVVIEAQASGLSCIVSKNVPIDVKISDLIDYVDIDSIEKWYDKIVDFKKNSNRNYDLSKSDYNIKNEYKKLIYIYDEGSVNKGE